ncbi:hypothetical protein ACFE04_007592 [Oxalis oulophora]
MAKNRRAAIDSDDIVTRSEEITSKVVAYNSRNTKEIRKKKERTGHDRQMVKTMKLFLIFVRTGSNWIWIDLGDDDDDILLWSAIVTVVVVDDDVEHMMMDNVADGKGGGGY